MEIDEFTSVTLGTKEFMQSKKPNLFVLTGAGFSLPYLLFEGKNLSTSLITQFILDKNQVLRAFRRYYGNEENDDLEKLVELFALLYKSLSEKRNEFPFEINFEHLIGFAEEMINYIEEVDAYDFTRSVKMKTKYVLSHLFNVNENFTNALKSIGKPYQALYDLKNILLSWISEFMVPSSLLPRVNNFIWNLLERYNVKYYTLNYDDLFFKALFNENNYKLPDYGNYLKSLNLGFKSLENNRFLRLTEILNSAKNHSCFHLHGSVLYTQSPILKFDNGVKYWYTYAISTDDASKTRINPHYTKNEVFYERSIDLQKSEITYQHYLISGFKQSKVFHEPYYTIYQRAFFDLVNADKILVIGYSFQDSHINSLLTKALVKAKELEIVDLSDESENLQKFTDKRNEVINIFRQGHAPDSLPLSFWKYDFIKDNNGSYILTGDGIKIRYFPFGTEEYIKSTLEQNSAESAIVQERAH